MPFTLDNVLNQLINQVQKPWPLKNTFHSETEPD